MEEKRMEKLNRELSRAGSEWQEDDLAEIMALLEKDYTKPRQEPSVLQLMSGMDAREPSKKEKKRKKTPEEAPEETAWKGPSVQQLMSGMGARELPRKNHADETSWEEYIPKEPHRAGIGEQPDFDETPVTPKKEWAVIPLSIVAALEVAAIVAVVVWWQQWII